MKINIKEVKTVITKSNLPDADYVINPYIGCKHACIYCYADFMKRFTGHSNESWGEFIDVKINAADTIPSNKAFGNSLVLIGSVTDPYQPIEAEYKITRQILEKLLPLQPRVEVLTKSSLIIRDIDLLKQFDNLRVGISMNTLDETVARKLEPYASSPHVRLRTLRNLQKEGISTYLFISPIFPGITNFTKLIEETRPYVEEVLFEGLNLRQNNKKKVLKFIQENHPDLFSIYETLDKNKQIWVDLEKKIKEFCDEMGITHKVYFQHAKERKNVK